MHFKIQNIIKNIKYIIRKLAILFFKSTTEQVL